VVFRCEIENVKSGERCAITCIIRLTLAKRFMSITIKVCNARWNGNVDLKMYAVYVSVHLI